MSFVHQFFRRRSAPARSRWLGRLSLLGLALLTGCSPSLNWRTLTPVPGTDLLLPCKPQHREEAVSLGDHTAQLVMTGCRADDLDFTFSYLTIPQGVNPEELLQRWREASLKPLGSALPNAAREVAIPGAAQVAKQWRLTTPNGLQVMWVWWVHEGRAHQLAVYGPQRASNFEMAADTFLASVKHKR